jgi:replicative DNA helicase
LHKPHFSANFRGIMAKIDLDFYEKVIFYNLLKKDAVFLTSCIDHLDKSIFKHKDIGPIVQLIKDFYLERETIPNHTEIKARLTTAELKTHFKNAVDSVRGLDKDLNEVELVKNTEYFLKQRMYYNLIDSAVTDQSNKKEIDSEEIQKQVERINSISLIDNLGLDYFADNDRVVEFLLAKDNFLSTGYKGFDNALGGGLMAEGRALYGISGETNVGKSIVLANIIVNLLLQNKTVMLYTLEMSEKRYSKRISSILTGIAIATLPDNIHSYKEYIRDFVSTHQSRLIIKEFAAKSVTAANLYAYTAKVMKVKQCKFDAIFFDYHTLLKSGTKQISKHDEIQSIAQECRGLTYALECPGITVAQLNRDSHKQEKPGLNNAAGSWNQISDFDAWITLAQTEIDREANILRYYGDKCRDGSKGNGGIFNIDYTTLRLTEDYDDSTDDLMLKEHLDANNMDGGDDALDGMFK